MRTLWSCTIVPVAVLAATVWLPAGPVGAFQNSSPRVEEADAPKIAKWLKQLDRNLHDDDKELIEEFLPKRDPNEALKKKFAKVLKHKGRSLWKKLEKSKKYGKVAIKVAKKLGRWAPPVRAGLAIEWTFSTGMKVGGVIDRRLTGPLRDRHYERQQRQWDEQFRQESEQFRQDVRETRRRHQFRQQLDRDLDSLAAEKRRIDEEMARLEGGESRDPEYREKVLGSGDARAWDDYRTTPKAGGTPIPSDAGLQGGAQANRGHQDQTLGSADTAASTWDDYRKARNPHARKASEAARRRADIEAARRKAETDFAQRQAAAEAALAQAARKRETAERQSAGQGRAADSGIGDLASNIAKFAVVGMGAYAALRAAKEGVPVQFKIDPKTGIPLLVPGAGALPQLKSKHAASGVGSGSHSWLPKMKRHPSASGTAAGSLPGAPGVSVNLEGCPETQQCKQAMSRAEATTAAAQNPTGGITEKAMTLARVTRVGIDSMKICQVHEAPRCRDGLERDIRELEKMHESALRLARQASGGALGQ